MDNGQRGTRRVVTTIAIAVAAALVWVAIATLWLWRNQERVVFQPPAVPGAEPALAERVAFSASDGHRLFGYVVVPAAASRAPLAIVAFHGNADLAAWLVPWARAVADRMGATVFLPEYRGYGGIPGRPTYATAASDALGAVRFARVRFASSRLALFGHSLGSAIATEVADHLGHEAPPLVLQSPFTSAREMAARMLVPPWPPLWRAISRVPYDTRAIVARVESRVSVAHGTRDLVVPVQMGRQVYALARHRGELLIVENAGHNDVAEVGGERYWSWLRAAVGSVPVGELEEKGDRRLP